MTEEKTIAYELNVFKQFLHMLHEYNPEKYPLVQYNITKEDRNNAFMVLEGGLPDLKLIFRQRSKIIDDGKKNNVSEEKTIVAYAKFVIKCTDFPEKDIERAIKEISFDGETEFGKWEVVDSIVVDVLPIRKDY